MSSRPRRRRHGPRAMLQGEKKHRILRDDEKTIKPS